MQAPERSDDNSLVTAFTKSDLIINWVIVIFMQLYLNWPYMCVHSLITAGMHAGPGEMR